MTKVTSMEDHDVNILSRTRIPASAAALALTLTACGGSSDDGTVDDAVADVSAAGDALASATSEAELEEAQGDLEDAAADMADDLEAQQSGGSATITVGEETWTFDGALCAFGEEETGQEGAEFVLSSIGDGLQFYLSIDSFGHSASVQDIENFENPSVSWESDFNAGEFITISGKDISGEVNFVDYETESFDGVAGSFEATCP
ncbi:MAG: hypothetical protein ACQERF_12575 [Actinomycetota bacterium]